MYCGAKALTLSSFVLGAISIGTLSLSVATDSWLFTDEDMVIGNETIKIQVQVRSGLFRFCTITESGRSHVVVVLIKRVTSQLVPV